jgi:hypothetical protein
MRTCLALLIAASLPANALADVCAVAPARVRQVRTYASAVHQRQQIQAYAAPAKTIVREKVREYVAAGHGQQYSHSGLNYDYGHQYFRVGLDVREDAVTEKLYGKLLADGTVAAMVSRAVAESVRAAGAHPAPTGQGSSPDQPAPEAGQPTGDLDYRKLLERNNCLKCHNSEAKKGGIDFTGDVPKALRWDAFDAVFTGRMPQGGKPVADADIDLFRQAAANAEK